MDQLANDLSFAIIDVEDLKQELPSRLMPPDGRIIKPIRDKLPTNSVSSTDVAKKSSCGSKVKLAKPVLRSASILLRSKKLILSDSESDEEKSGDPLCYQNKEIKEIPGPFGDCGSLSRKHRMKKHKRKKESKDERLFGQLCVGQTSFAQYFGKRKRSTTVNQQSTSNFSEDSHNILDEHGNNGNSCELNSMDCESQSCDSSSLSESVCDSDHFVEADDEQSDFYEVMSRSNRDICKPSSSGNCDAPESSESISRTKYSPSIPIPQNPFASVPPTPSSSYNSLTGGGSSSILWKRRRRNH